MSDADSWRRCSACKEPIALGAPYWVCSVSTCNRKRTGLAFCSVRCWEVHLPGAHHREAWALERRAPATREQGQAGASPRERAQAGAATREQAQAGGEAARAPRRILAAPPGAARRNEPPREILIVASRLKEYVRQRAGYNTSDGVLEPLSDIVREVCDRAIESARREGRKTVLERDIPSS